MKFETYPFEKLAALLEGSKSAKDEILLTIGEPQFPTPAFIQEALCEHAPLLQKYPKSAGESYLKEAMIGFVQRRFGVTLKMEELIPTFGTREVLFNFPQYVLFDKPKPKMAYTNPFYQIYEGAAIASKAEVLHIDLVSENNFKPVIEEATLADVDLVILNFPNNPTTATLTVSELAVWVEWALKYDFVLLNDECYSEIYSDTPPISLLEASVYAGNSGFKNVVVLNSISKRSCAPGLRSGFIAGDAALLEGYMQYRTYVGCALPLPLQKAAALAWADEEHVKISQAQYAQNFALAQEILGIVPARATFYLWIAVGDDVAFTKYLYETQGVKVLPGSYLGRSGAGEGYVRLALVEAPKTVKEALTRFKNALDVFKAMHV